MKAAQAIKSGATPGTLNAASGDVAVPVAPSCAGANLIAVQAINVAAATMT
ncbi:hypothetical protein D9M68_533000 [compost metagenome]